MYQVTQPLFTWYFCKSEDDGSPRSQHPVASGFADLGQAPHIPPCGAFFKLSGHYCAHKNIWVKPLAGLSDVRYLRNAGNGTCSFSKVGGAPKSPAFGSGMWGAHSSGVSGPVFTPIPGFYKVEVSKNRLLLTRVVLIARIGGQLTLDRSDSLIEHYFGISVFQVNNFISQCVGIAVIG